MKRLKFMSLIFVVIMVIFTAIMAYVRLDNDHQLRLAFYRQWHRYYVVRAGENESYIDATPQAKSRLVLSEGQGYGMYIAALAAKRGYDNKAAFDRLNSFYLNSRATIHKRKTALMIWRQRRENGHWQFAHNTATDGDLFIAEALLLASREYRDIYYHGEAVSLLQDILRYEYNSQTQTLTVGNWAQKGSRYYNLLRTSNVVPEFFTDFYHATGDWRWLLLKKSMLRHLEQLSQQHRTGLVPDFAWVTSQGVRPVSGRTVASQDDGSYAANACRVPLMLANSRNPRARKVVRRLLHFFSQQKQISAGYTLTTLTALTADHM